MSEREHHIKALENLLSHYKAREKCEGYYDSTLKDNIKSLEYAISSLKTDDTYQLMYEGVEVYDKDTVAWIFRKLQLEIKEKYLYDLTNENSVDEYEDFEHNRLVEKILSDIQSKIDMLKEGENKNGNE